MLAFIIQMGFLFFCWRPPRPPFEKSQAGSWQGLRSLFLWKDFAVCPPRIPYHGAQSKDVPSCFLILLMTIRFPFRFGLLTNKRRTVSNHKRYNHNSKTTKNTNLFKTSFFVCFSPPFLPRCLGPWQCQRAPPSHVGGGSRGGWRHSPRYKSWGSEACWPWTAGEVRSFGPGCLVPLRILPPSKLAILRIPTHPRIGTKQQKKPFHWSGSIGILRVVEFFGWDFGEI